MIGIPTAFLQQFLNIAQRERISKIAADRTEHERRFRLPPFEDLRSRRDFPILSRCQPPHMEVCNTADCRIRGAWSKEIGTDCGGKNGEELRYFPAGTL
jgi:hypothetical protein